MGWVDDFIKKVRNQGLTQEEIDKIQKKKDKKSVLELLLNLRDLADKLNIIRYESHKLNLNLKEFQRYKYKEIFEELIPVLDAYELLLNLAEKDKKRTREMIRTELNNLVDEYIEKRKEIAKEYGEDILKNKGLNEIFNEILKKDYSNLESTWIETMKPNYLRLKKVLKKNGLEEIVCEKGQKVHLNYHHVAKAVKSKEYQHGEILEMKKKGYMYKSYVLRYAEVVVAIKDDVGENEENKKGM